MLPNENNHIHYRRSGLVRGRCSVELDFFISFTCLQFVHICGSRHRVWWYESVVLRHMKPVFL